MTANNYLEFLKHTLLRIVEEDDGNILGDWSINAFSVPNAKMDELHMLWCVEMEVYYIGPNSYSFVLTSDKYGAYTIYFLIPRKHDSECGVRISSFTLRKD